MRDLKCQHIGFIIDGMNKIVFVFVFNWIFFSSNVVEKKVIDLYQ